jgi:hypothetical protein
MGSMGSVAYLKDGADMCHAAVEQQGPLLCLSVLTFASKLCFLSYSQTPYGLLGCCREEKAKKGTL